MLFLSVIFDVNGLGFQNLDGKRPEEVVFRSIPDTLPKNHNKVFRRWLQKANH